MKTQTEAIATDTENKVADYTQAGTDSAAGYIDKMSGGIGSSVVGVGIKVALISALYTAAAAFITTSGTTAASGYIDTMQNKLGETSGIKGKLEDIRRDVQALQGPLTSAGSYAADGIINGVVGRLNQRYSEVAAAVARINAKAREALQINSPSKVMMETGGYAGEGLIIGTVNAITEGLPDIQETVIDFADTTGYSYVNEVSGLQNSMMAIPSAMAGGFYQPTIGMTEGSVQSAAEAGIDYERLGKSVAAAMAGVTVNIDGQPAGEILAPYINENISDIAGWEGRGMV